MNKLSKTAGPVHLALAALLPLALGAALLWYYDVYVHWQPGLYPFAYAAVTAGLQR